MNLIASKTEFSDEEHRQIRLGVERAKAADNLTEAQIARESEVSASTLNSYLKGVYRGDNNSPAALLHKWLEARKRMAELAIRLPKAPVYIPLQASRRIAGLLGYAHSMGRIVVIAGNPGVSKTATCRQFAADMPRTTYVAMDPSTAGVSTMLAEILRALGEPEAKGTPQQLQNRISAHLEQAKSLLIVDEAQHLGDKAIETLRTLNDRAKARNASVGVAIVGNEAAYAKIGTTGTKAQFAQVSSRVSMRRYLVSPDPADVAALAEAWADANDEVIGPGEVKFLQDIAQRHGGLRNVEMTFEAALMACFAESQPLTLEHLQGAFDQLSGLNRAA